MARIGLTRSPGGARGPRPPRAWAVAGALIGLLVALVLFAPARWLAQRVQSATGGQVLLLEPRGTVWKGSAQLVLTGGAGSNDRAALPSRLHWRLRPAPGGFNALLTSPCCIPQPVALRGTVGWRRFGLDVGDSRTQWPAALLAGLGTPWNTLAIEGDLSLATRDLAMEWAAGRLGLEGRAELTAERVSSRLSTLRPMGSYRVVLAGGDTPTLQVSTLEGSLLLNGQGQWVGSRLRFKGEASAAPNREAALSNLLNIIGRRTGARSIITIG